MTSATSRGLLRATLILGGAQVTNVVISIVRMKLIAMLLGPTGVGLLGVYANLMETVAVTAGLGMNTSGVRQIAKAREKADEVSQLRTLISLSLFLQGVIAMAAVWVLRRPLATWVFGDALRATEVGLVGISVFFAMLAMSQTTLLQGAREIGNLGRATIIGALAGSIIGLVAIYFRRDDALVAYLIIQSAATAATAYYFARRLHCAAAATVATSRHLALWQNLVTLGGVFMLAGLAYNVTLLLARALVTKQIGLDAAGYLAASWGISIQSIGFLFSAMASDYYPRLAEVVSSPTAANRLINEQVQLGLSIAGPFLLILIGLAPWIMVLLYSAEFRAASPLVQWQTTGNIFRLVSLPVSYFLIASARKWPYLAAEIFLNMLFLLFLWQALPLWGVDSAGPAFLFSYVLYTVALTWATRRMLSFKWEPLSLYLMCGYLILACTLLLLSRHHEVISASVSIVFALAGGLLGLRTVTHKIGTNKHSTDRIAYFFAAIGWPMNWPK